MAGVGIGQVLPSTDSADDASAGSAADTLDARGAGRERRVGPGPTAADAGAEAGPRRRGPEAGRHERAPGEARRRAATAPAAVSELTSDAALKPQVRKLRARHAPTASYAADRACVARDEAEAGTVVAVTYDDLPGALVFRDSVAGTQQVDIFLCGEPDARTLPDAHARPDAGRAGRAEHPRPTIGCTRRTSHPRSHQEP